MKTPQLISANNWGASLAVWTLTTKALLGLAVCLFLVF
jgi:hypothetical protein